MLACYLHIILMLTDQQIKSKSREIPVRIHVSQKCMLPKTFPGEVEVNGCIQKNPCSGKKKNQPLI